MQRNPQVDRTLVTDVIYGCANQGGEDNRNVARMSALLAGLPLEVPGSTVNQLCGSGLDALASAARAIKAGEIAEPLLERLAQTCGELVRLSIVNGDRLI
jgi:acetyl-CoA acyltransferase